MAVTDFPIRQGSFGAVTSQHSSYKHIQAGGITASDTTRCCLLERIRQ